jgi:Holliday junction resolvasome RuvABC endonuclease subunit
MEPLIFSLDPGVTKIGWALTNLYGKTIDYGLATDPCPDEPFNKRMNALINYLIFFYSSHLDRNVKCVVWEVVPSFAKMRNKDLVQATANTLKVLAFQRNLLYSEYQAREWHKLFLNNPNCTKEEVKAKVLELEEIPKNKPYDVFDAIAIGKVAARQNKWESFDDIS